MPVPPIRCETPEAAGGVIYYSECGRLFRPDRPYHRYCWECWQKRAPVVPRRFAVGFEPIFWVVCLGLAGILAAGYCFRR